MFFKLNFPSGLVTQNEWRMLDKIKEETNQSNFWMPMTWAGAIVTKARAENHIKCDILLKTIQEEIIKFKGGCGSLTSYDWINIPLVYTQVI